MATIVLGVLGAGAGALIAGPAGAVKGAMLGWSIGTTVGSLIDQSQQHFYTADMGRTSDLRVTVAAYGTSIPQCWGLCRIPGIVVWSTDLKEHEQDVNSGGGGSGGPTVTTRKYSYTVSFALALCKGGRMTSTSLKKIYADDLVVYDSTVTTSQNKIVPRFYVGSETQAADSLIIAAAGNSDIPAGTDNPAFRGTCYMVVQDMDLTDFGNRLPNFSVLLDTGQLYVSDVITDVLTQVGVNASTQLDVTQVTTVPITGGLIASRLDAKSAILPFLTAYDIDLVDVDGLIRAIPRGGATVGTLLFADMAATTVGSGTAPPTARITKTRVEDNTLAKRIDVGYFSTTIDLQQATQGAIRQSALSNNLVSISLPLSLNETEARRIAEKQLYLQWVERMKYEVSAMPWWRFLSAADAILVQTDAQGTLVRARVVEAEMGSPGEVKLKLTRDQSAMFTQVAVGAAPTGGFKALKVPVQTLFFAWSGKELKLEDQTSAGFYIAATGGVGWSGCSVFYSVDGGSTYNLIGGIGSRATFGIITNALPPTYTVNANGFDTTSSLNLTLQNSGVLNSTNESSVKNGLGNYALVLKFDTSVANATNYEVIGFANTSLVSVGAYTGSDLLRALKGTAATGHAANDAFIVLDGAISRMSVANNLGGTTILVKCVSPGFDISAVSPQTVFIQVPTSPNGVGTTAVVTATNDLTNMINSNRVPWYRSRCKFNSFNDSGGTITPGSADFASGYTVSTWYAHGPDGSLFFSDPGLELSVQLRIGIKNNNTSAVTVTYFVPAVDNGARGIWNGTQIFQIFSGGTTAANGTFTIPANSQGILELYYYNASTGKNYDPSDPASFTFFMDALSQGGVAWYDVGL